MIDLNINYANIDYDLRRIERYSEEYLEINNLIKNNVLCKDDTLKDLIASYFYNNYIREIMIYHPEYEIDACITSVNDFKQEIDKFKEYLKTIV